MFVVHFPFKSSVSSPLGIRNRFKRPARYENDIARVRVDVEIVEKFDALRVSPVASESGLIVTPDRHSLVVPKAPMS